MPHANSTQSHFHPNFSGAYGEIGECGDQFIRGIITKFDQKEKNIKPRKVFENMSQSVIKS